MEKDSTITTSFLQVLEETPTPPRLKSVKRSLSHAPTANEPFAVVTITVKTEDGLEISDFGLATVSDSDGSDKLAIENAKSNADRQFAGIFVAANALSPGRQSDSTPPWGSTGRVIDVKPKPSKSKKRSLDGGGSNPASERQLAFVKSMCSERGLNPDEAARRRFGKGVADLLGNEAHEFINELKDKDY